MAGRENISVLEVDVVLKELHRAKFTKDMYTFDLVSNIIFFLQCFIVTTTKLVFKLLELYN